MDRPTNPLTITTALTFAEPLEFARVEALVRERLLRYPRFVQRVVEGRFGAHWEPDPYFDLRDHLHRTALPAPGDRAALAELVSDLMSTPLDRKKPLWQLHVVEGFEGGAALVARIHHCVADGVALVGVMIALTDEGEGAPAIVGTPPAPPASSAGELARRLGSEALTLGRLLLLPSDPDTPLRGALGTRKLAAWSDPIPLETLKQIARSAPGKVNDVLMAAVSASLRRYLHGRDGLREGLGVRALVPVYLQGKSGGGDLGNHFGLVFVDLPLDPHGALDRVRETKRRMDAIKAQPDAAVALGVLAAMGVATAEIEHIGVDLFSKKASLMVTNVPGPPARIHLAGKALESAIVWAPVSGSIGLGVSMLSYGGAVRLGVATDARVIPDPEAIVAGFEAEIAAQRAESRE
jgi:hypothetical protein